jgi:integration host factor subunit alpha
MNKSDIIKAVAKTNRCSQKQASRIVNCLIEIIKHTLADGEDISIRGFGRFYLKKRGQRPGWNFATGKALTINPKKIAAFKGSAKLIERLNKTDFSTSLPTDEFAERRSQRRIDDLPDGIAIVRVGGIPVYQFKLKDVSVNGTSFLVQNDSNILRNIRVGQEIDIRVGLNAEGTVSTIYQRCEIRHITRQEAGRFKGNFIIGVNILGRMVTQL